jgi:hypothetical protein
VAPLPAHDHGAVAVADAMARARFSSRFDGNDHAEYLEFIINRSSLIGGGHQQLPSSESG